MSLVIYLICISTFGDTVVGGFGMVSSVVDAAAPLTMLVEPSQVFDLPCR